jgi:hypothetical protein
MLIVNSGLPLMNDLVPSTGSTRKNESPVLGMCPAEAASSDTTGTPGAARSSPARMISSDCRSATVTGLRSAFVSAVTPAAKWAMSTCAASRATPRRRSASSFISAACMGAPIQRFGG